jgi:predicted RNA-binding Zn ribbon-like protein
MRAAPQDADEWLDGFLFVANKPILDFLNTRPVLPDGPKELLPDAHALERWLIASGMAKSHKVKLLLRSWRNSPEASAFLEELIAFRERLRSTVLRIESGSLPTDSFLAEVNARLLRYPRHTSLTRRDGKILREPLFEPRKAADFWAPIIAGTADLLAETETSRLRRCESCVVHFFDASRKGARRWCSMNICGNKLKVAAYQKRKRASHAPQTDDRP